MNTLPCNSVQIDRGVTFTMQIEAETPSGDAFAFNAAGLTTTAIFYDGQGGEEVATCDVTTTSTSATATLSAEETGDLDVGALWLEVRTENESGFVWQFVKGFVNVY
jgi:hypothetical protein